MNQTYRFIWWAAHSKTFTGFLISSRGEATRFGIELLYRTANEVGAKITTVNVGSGGNSIHFGLTLKGCEFIGVMTIGSNRVDCVGQRTRLAFILSRAIEKVMQKWALELSVQSKELQFA